MNPTLSLTITAEPPAWPAADWAALRAAGLAYIEQYASDLWTDYNRHDPGITTLELLCYAITDLSQRTALATEDVLASSYGSAQAASASFRPAHQALTTSPVTLLDYRKLFIDIVGVRNAWLVPRTLPVRVDLANFFSYRQLSYGPVGKQGFQLRGLYDITIELDPAGLPLVKRQLDAATGKAGQATDEQARQEVLRQVRATYQANRNLGEDVQSIREVPVQQVIFCAEIDLAPTAVVSEVYAQLLLVVDTYLSPPIQRYSLAEMRAQPTADGQPLPIDELFEGPLLRNGFIKKEELEASNLREAVYASDLINLLLAVPGVLTVKNLVLNTLRPAADFPGQYVVDGDPAGYAWLLPLRPGHQAQLHVDRVALSFHKGLIPVGNAPDKARALARFQALREQAAAARLRTFEALAVPAGTVYDLAAYRPLAHDFPETYGIGPAGLPAAATAERQNQARQLKAYLSFFDQLLSNYLAQLVHVKDLFGSDATNLATYFGQVVAEKDLAGLAELYGPAADDAGRAAVLADVLAAQEAFEDNPVRKNQLLDHLLARFGEDFSEYALLMHSLYGTRTEAGLAQDKARFLRTYEPAGAGPEAPISDNVSSIQAYDYSLKAWDQLNVAGIAHRFAHLSGMSDEERQGGALRTVIVGQQAGAYFYQLYSPFDPGKTAPAELYLTSAAVYPTAEAARHALEHTFYRGQWQVEETAPGKGGYWHVLRLPGSLAAQAHSPQFASREEAQQSLDGALRALIYGGEVIHVVEHVLLRPGYDAAAPAVPAWMKVCTEPDGSFSEPLDPYSFRVSLVLPGYTTRTQNVDFRRYAERLLRAELPAHVLARICWVGEEQLAQFEGVYAAWRTQKARTLDVAQEPATYTQATAALIACLDGLYTIYPPGVLHDCNNADEENPIILGRTSLGSGDDSYAGTPT